MRCASEVAIDGSRVLVRDRSPFRTIKWSAAGCLRRSYGTRNCWQRNLRSSCDVPARPALHHIRRNGPEARYPAPDRGPAGHEALNREALAGDTAVPAVPTPLYQHHSLTGRDCVRIRLGLRRFSAALDCCLHGGNFPPGPNILGRGWWSAEALHHQDSY